MFSKEQIKSIQASVQKGEDYPRFVSELKKIGVVSYKHTVSNGDTTFYAVDGSHITLAGHQMKLKIAQKSHPAELARVISEHKKGESDYISFCRLAAGCGVDEWFADLKAMVITYTDLNGELVDKEKIMEY